MKFLIFISCILLVVLEGCIVSNRIEWKDNYKYTDIINNTDSIIPSIIVFRDYRSYFVPPVFIVECKTTDNYGLEFQFTTRRLDSLTLDSIQYSLKTISDSLIDSKCSVVNKTFINKMCDSIYNLTSTRNCDKRISINTGFDIVIDKELKYLKIDLQLFFKSNDNKPVVMNYPNLKLQRNDCRGIYLFPF